MNRAAVFVVASLSFAPVAAAHHGGGTFDGSKEIELTGKLTRLDLVNPHSWIYFDVTDKDGRVSPHRCEMRAATVLRRSGWTKEMFRPGQRITIQGSPDRIDPNSCYLNTIILQDGSRADRYGQFKKPAVAVAKRALETSDRRAEHLRRLGAGAAGHDRPAGPSAARSSRSAGWINSSPARAESAALEEQAQARGCTVAPS